MNPSLCYQVVRVVCAIFLVALVSGVTRTSSGQCLATNHARLQQPGEVGCAHFGASVAMDGDVLVVGASRGDGLLCDGPEHGSAEVYRHNGVYWAHEATLVSPGAVHRNGFGEAVAVDGDLIAIGAPHELAHNVGAVFLFRFDGESWALEAEVVAEVPGDRGGFGVAVALHAGQLLVGATTAVNGGDPFGAALLYEHDGGQWMRSERFAARSLELLFPRFGASVAMSDDTIAIANGREGLVVLFGEVDGAWIEVLQLANERSDFGSGLALRDNELFIGPSLGPDGTGVDQYQYDDSQWTLHNRIMPSSTEAESFGWSIAFDGHVLAVGEPDGGVEPAGGLVHVFLREGQTWVQPVTLVDRARFDGDRLGDTIAVGNGMIIAGAPENQVFAERSGTAVVWGSFRDRCGNGVLDICELEDQDCNTNGVPDPCDLALGTSQDINNNGIPDECERDVCFVSDFIGPPGYIESTFRNAVDVQDGLAIMGSHPGVRGVAYLVDVETGQAIATLSPSNGSMNDEFGTSVALDGDIALVGAPGRHGWSLGPDPTVPAVYVFDISNPLQPLELRKLTPSAGGSSAFGWSVALDGGIAAVGAIDAHAEELEAVYLFDVHDGSELACIPAKAACNTDTPGLFGISVAMQGDRLVIGANAQDALGLDYVGSAWLFDISVPSQPALVRKLIVRGPWEWVRLGSWVDLNDRVVIVGSLPSSHHSAVYLFDRNTGELIHVLEQGGAVALSEMYAVVGFGSGATTTMHLFDVQDPYQPLAIHDGLQLPDGDDAYLFGDSVAIDGDVVVVHSIARDMGEDWAQMHIYRLDVDCESGVHCFADLNHDRVVDMAHLIELVAHWGEQSSEVSYDLTHDGVVDINDLLAMLGAWGECEE